jgi:phosphoserine phosphatase RsbU/P
MTPIRIGDPAFRTFLALLALMLVVFAGITFFSKASQPTDENVFVDVPSFVAVGTPFAAVPLDARPFQGKGAFTEARGAGDSVVANDLLLSIGGVPVRTMESCRRVLAGLTTDTTTIVILRPAEFRTIRWSVRRSNLVPERFIEQTPAVLVTDVARGGASDRAGMKLGDMIVRINGVGFKTSIEADLVMRQGTSGKAITYDVVRNGVPLTLNVILARFGFSLGTLTFLLSGLIYILIGTFLGLKRPNYFSARMLALWMVSLGYFIAVLAIRRDPTSSLFVVTRDVLAVYGAFLGTVFAFHAALVFPWQRPIGVWRKRGLMAMYCMAAVSPIILLFRQELLSVLVYSVVLLVGLFVSPPFMRGGMPQQRALGRPIKIVGIVTIGGSLGCAVLLSVLGFANLVGLVGFFLVFIPLSYLYTIGHYRLLDLDLRVRRNVQYSLLSWLWGGLVACICLWVFFALPAMPLPLPHVVLSGFSVEVRQELPTPQEQLVAQRAVSMVLGVGVWFLLWKLRTVGQRLLDRKYHRTQFDYKRAAKEISDVLASKLSMTDLARGLVDALLDLLKIRAAGLLVFRDGRTCCCDAASGVSDTAWHDFSCSLDARFADALSGMADALRVDHLPADLAAPLDAMQFEYIIPIRAKGALSGALIVGRKLSETPHSAEDLSFLSGLAQQVSVSIENAFLYEGLAEQERMRHELSIARQIQLSSLPSVTPQIAGLDISGRSIPALEVGGDFFDYLDGTGNDVMVIVGDVSGKGTSAALYMSKVQGILRSLHQFGLAPQELFLRANRLLCADLQKNSFITATAALFLPQRRQVKLVRAGHLPVFIYRASTGRVERIVPHGLGLGLSDAAIFASELEERTQDYRGGDILVLITDGVTEARDLAGQEYGEDRLTEVIRNAAALTAEEIRDLVVGDLSAFGGGADPHDDQTVVVIRMS